MITQERVKELFDYQDGQLIRKVGVRGSHIKAGSPVGYNRGRGYIATMIGRKSLLIHRLIWLWHHGYLPEHQVDHINRNPSDNRIENLREVTSLCNNRNTGNRATNTSGVKGVRWVKPTKNWRAHIKVGGKTIQAGVSDCFIEAVCHRLAVEQSLGWAGCDSSSPAFQYVQKYLEGKRNAI